MVLNFVVGVHEQHTVTFSFDKFWGRLTILVDGQSAVDTVQFVSLSTLAAWEFDVGMTERHRVRIEKRRAVFLAGFRPQPVTAFVDGILVAQGIA